MSGGSDYKKNSKGFLKEKVLQIYDKLFQGQDITQGRADFWDDFFLLKANVKWLSSHFEKINTDDLPLLQPQLQRLLIQCLHAAQFEKHPIRVANAIQTMDALISGVYRCKVSLDCALDASEFLLGTEQVEEFMQRYTTLCSEMFREDRPDRLRCFMLNSVHTLATASSNFLSNPFAVGLLNSRIFDVLRLTLVSAQLRYVHGLAACKLLGILTQFEKFKVSDPGAQLFCITDDELLLNGVSSTVSLALSAYNVLFRQQNDSSANVLSSVSSFFGNLFAGDMVSNSRLRPCDSLLMCMFGITKTTAQLSTILSYSTAYCDTAGSALDSLSVTGSLRGDCLRTFSSDNIMGFMSVSGNIAGRVVPVEVEHDTDRPPMYNGHNAVVDKQNMGTLNTVSPRQSELLNTVENTDPAFPVSESEANVGSMQSDVFGEDATNGALEPRNLLADLLEYCSIVMQDVKNPEPLNSCHLCLAIVLLITQNRLACSILHDPHITFKVWIHKHRSRYRKPSPTSCANFSTRPIAVAIFSLIVEFMRGHLMKKLPHRLYRTAFSICRNLLCYQAEHKIRLDFDWKQLWSVLLSLLQFVLNLDNSLLPTELGLELILKVLELFNFCILYGDSFLQAADVYDDLYYELIRMRGLFENIYEHGLSHSTGPNPDWRPIAVSVVLQMGNIRSIVNHFNAKIVAFSAANSLTSLTEGQVLSVIRDNYDSLTLRVHDNLCRPEFYSEEIDDPLFTSMLDTVLRQSRKDCLDTGVHLQTYFHELSIIH